MTETASATTTIDAGILALVTASGENSRDHGFHEDWPTRRDWAYLHPDEVKQVRRAIAEKLALIHEEVSEALGEIRSGRAPLEVYFRDSKGVFGEVDTTYTEQDYDMAGVPLLKPEGFLVELADAVIRIADLAYLVGDTTGEQLAYVTAIKAKYNASRPFKHGRKF